MVLHPRFTEEHEELRRAIRTLVGSELAPHAEDWEREGYFPDWVFKRLGDLGYLGLRHSPQYGGQGGDWGHAIVMAEEMARVGLGRRGYGGGRPGGDGHTAVGPIGGGTTEIMKDLIGRSYGPSASENR